jgi:hypothetical protein
VAVVAACAVAEACHTAAEAETVAVTVDRAAAMAAADAVNLTLTAQVKQFERPAVQAVGRFFPAALNPESVLLVFNPERLLVFNPERNEGSLLRRLGCHMN